MTKGVKIITITPIGTKKEHKKLLLKEGEKSFIALEFYSKNDFNIGDRIDIIYSIHTSEFNSTIDINLLLA